MTEPDPTLEIEERGRPLVALEITMALIGAVLWVGYRQAQSDHRWESERDGSVVALAAFIVAFIWFMLAKQLSRLSKAARFGVAFVIALGIYASGMAAVFGRKNDSAFFLSPVWSAVMLLGLLSAAWHEDRRWARPGVVKSWGARFGLFAALWSVLAAFEVTFSVMTYGGPATVWFGFGSLELALWWKVIRAR